ncbi:MAG: RNA 2',3'-cyclic phosphodiesterase [Acidobacteriota bacterium]|nr:RNA 2',3'-cyclic phosphodiesterase [Acidobacteriota bacterium]MDH3528037.1 RNA 2',3'-cyclic phosphodiesterase [Acidobacteriota bacterium]
MHRVFIAINVNDRVREGVRRHVSELKGRQENTRVTWVKIPNLHLTLKFLGDTGQSELRAIEDAVSETARSFTQFQFAIAEPGVFPNKKRPSVLWVGVHDEDGHLNRLKTAIDQRLESLQIPREKRHFRPHLTIARLRQPANSQRLADAHLAASFEPVIVNANHVSIYESRLDNSGAVYVERLTAGFSD